MENNNLGKVALRRKQILEILNNNPIISLTDLAKELAVTTETIRNDLKSKELTKKVLQAHGSVALSHTTIARDIPYSFRKELNSHVKTKMATQAARLVLPGQVVVIEHNSMSVPLIHELSYQPELLKSVTIITNSFSIVQYVQQKDLNCKIIFLGGNFSIKQENAYGTTTVGQMANLRGDISFLSPGAMNERLEITAYKEYDTLLQQEIIKNCQKNVLLLEKNKYPEIAIRKVNMATAYQIIITELAFTAQQTTALTDNGIQIIKI